MTTLIIIGVYLGLLLALGVASNRLLRGTANDYYLASHSIGPFLLLMSMFGTTMTAFALVGSSGAAYAQGIGVYAKMASWSGIVHSACFFIVGVKIWEMGRRFGYVTQIQYFRDRFESDALGLVLFPVLVLLIIPYLLIGVLGAGTVIEAVTRGSLPSLFPATNGAVPQSVGGAVICLIVLIYVFFGGVRGTAWANAFQTIVFIVLGIIMFSVISSRLGGMANATQMVVDRHADKLTRTGQSKWQYLQYGFIPLSVAMFPHLFQHKLTAKSARTFKLTVVAHPVLIMLVWAPCVLLGVWATSAVRADGILWIPVGTNQNAVLGMMVNKMTDSSFSGTTLSGLLTAGILAAIMSSLDSQFLCVGSMFSNDIVGHYIKRDGMSDKSKIFYGRMFVIGIVVLTYLISLITPGKRVFPLAIWCFTGFAAMFPLIFSALYWKRVTRQGAIACVITVAVGWIVMFSHANWLVEFAAPAAKAAADATSAAAESAHHLESIEDYLLFDTIMPAAFLTVLSAIVLVVVSLMTPAPRREVVEKFFGGSSVAG